MHLGNALLFSYALAETTSAVSAVIAASAIIAILVIIVVVPSVIRSAVVHRNLGGSVWRWGVTIVSWRWRICISWWRRVSVSWRWRRISRARWRHPAPSPVIVVASDPYSGAVVQSRISVRINIVDYVRVVHRNIHVFLLNGFNNNRLFLDDLHLFVSL